MMHNWQGTSGKVQDSQTGFTIIEVIFAIAIFTLLAGGIFGLTGVMLRDARKQDALLTSTDLARKVSFRFISELRDAVTSNTGAYPLESVGAQSIIFYSNVDSDAQIERVRYFLSSGRLFRGVVNPTGSPLTYNTASEVTSSVQDNVANGSAAIFHYYDDDYAGSEAELSQPVSIPDVRHVKMELRITNTGGLSNANYFTVTNSGSLRNLKTNLGE